MSQDGFSQINLTEPGFSNSQEVEILNNFNVELLGISSAEKARDSCVVQPTDEAQTPLPVPSGTASSNTGGVKSLSLRQNSRKREHWKKGVGLWLPKDTYREQRRERARSRSIQRKRASDEEPTEASIIDAGKVASSINEHISDDSLNAMAVSQFCAVRTSDLSSLQVPLNKKDSLVVASHTSPSSASSSSSSKIGNVPKVQTTMITSTLPPTSNIPSTSAVHSEVLGNLFSTAISSTLEKTKSLLLEDVKLLHRNYSNNLQQKVTELNHSLVYLLRLKEGMTSFMVDDDPLKISLNETIEDLTAEVAKDKQILSLLQMTTISPRTLAKLLIFERRAAVMEGQIRAMKDVLNHLRAEMEMLKEAVKESSTIKATTVNIEAVNVYRELPPRNIEPPDPWPDASPTHSPTPTEPVAPPGEPEEVW